MFHFQCRSNVSGKNMVANTVGDSAQFNQGVLVQLDKLIA